jgi:myo-inositol-1(or 4)-monophosphatase
MTAEQQRLLCELIRRLGAEAQRLRDNGLNIDQKTHQDFVSQADLYVEQQLNVQVSLAAHLSPAGWFYERRERSDRG